MLIEKEFDILNEGIMQKQHYKNDNEVKIAVLENSVGHIFQSLERMEKSIERLSENVNQRFDSVDKKFESISNRIWTIFFWLLGSMGLLGAIMARGFHWLGF